MSNLMTLFTELAPSLRNRYQTKPKFDPAHSYLEGEAIVDEAIQPGRLGRVHFQGSWWYARCSQNIVLAQGVAVRVIGIHNITLLVEPAC
jgi:membrane protein implicated in regulation of membrane protease activity